MNRDFAEMQLYTNLRESPLRDAKSTDGLACLSIYPFVIMVEKRENRSSANMQGDLQNLK
jgi:hypothetical protein